MPFNRTPAAFFPRFILFLFSSSGDGADSVAYAMLPFLHPFADWAFAVKRDPFHHLRCADFCPVVSRR